MKSVLVTGSNGFIGRYVRSRLEELGIYVCPYDITGNRDVTDLGVLRHTAEEADADGIIHLAGVLGTHELWDNVEEAARVNIVGAYNAGKVALDLEIPLVSIEQPHVWYNPYEATKLAARRILTGMAYDSGLGVGFVTAHNAFGPGQAHGEGHPVKYLPAFATSAWAGEDIQVWGHGDQYLSPVYAGDVADQLVATLFRAAAGEPIAIEEIHAGADELWTVREMAEFVRSHVYEAGEQEWVEIETNPMRRGEQDFPYPTPGEGEGLFPVDMDKLAQTIDWYRP
jgi:UDP-glucose 4-epimerase